MTAPEPSEGGRPASSAYGVQVQQRGEGETTSPPQEENRHELVMPLPVVIYIRNNLS
jgi:hypothetical protein